MEAVGGGVGDDFSVEGGSVAGVFFGGEVGAGCVEHLAHGRECVEVGGIVGGEIMTVGIEERFFIGDFVLTDKHIHIRSEQDAHTAYGVVGRGLMGVERLKPSVDVHAVP